MLCLKISAVIFNFFLIFHSVNSFCTMYGQCHHDLVRDTMLNCYYEEGIKEAEPLDKNSVDYDTAVKEIKNHCSYFFYDDEGNEKGS